MAFRVKKSIYYPLPSARMSYHPILISPYIWKKYKNAIKKIIRDISNIRNILTLMPFLLIGTLLISGISLSTHLINNGVIIKSYIDKHAAVITEISLIKVAPLTNIVKGESDPAVQAVTGRQALRINHLHGIAKEIVTKTSYFETKLRDSYIRFNHTPSIMPISGKVLSAYGYRLSPFTAKMIHHEGIDIQALPGTPVKSSGEGVVHISGWNAGYGLTVMIDHGYGIKTLYGHLSKCSVKKGQQVKKGQYIAKTGTTGLTTGPHLHYEVWSNGTAVNPKKYFNLDIYSASAMW